MHRTTACPNGSAIDLPHTADIQVHAQGATLAASFVGAAYGMYDYMTRRSALVEDAQHTTHIAVTSPDGTVGGLLVSFLDELLFRFFTGTFFASRRIVITAMAPDASSLEATCYGEPFVPGRHPCGCEVKAVTSSNLQVSTAPPYDIYVILDI